VGENRLDRFAVLDDETRVRQLEVDLDAVRQLGGRGLIVTAPADDDSEIDFVSRFFAPSAGVDEDPVTGSAHCALGPYWANRLDQDEVVGRQVSKRGGMVRVRVTDEGVDLEGQAVTVFDAELREIAEP
jgi:PhzF family phenazine biosynthesis protein